MKAIEIINEDEKFDQNQRDIALHVHKLISRWLIDSQHNLKDILIPLRDSTAYGFSVNTVPNMPKEFHNLIIVFEHSSKNAGGWFGPGSGDDKLKYIILNIIKPRENISTLVPKFTVSFKTTFIHEFIHYLDDARGQDNDRHRFKSDSTEKKYVNRPSEFNAYFQQTTSQILRDIKVSPAPAIRTFENMNVEQFIQFVKKSYPNISRNFNKKYRRKIDKRLARFYIETVRSKIEELKMKNDKDENYTKSNEGDDSANDNDNNIIDMTKHFGTKKGMFYNPDAKAPVSRKDKLPFDRFETRKVGKLSAEIIGIRADGYEESLGVSQNKLAFALAQAYNAGGYSKQKIERIPLSQFFRKSTDDDLNEERYRFKRIGSDDREAVIRGHKITITRYNPRNWGEKGPVEYQLFVNDEWSETFLTLRDAVKNIDWAITASVK